MGLCLSSPLDFCTSELRNRVPLANQGDWKCFTLDIESACFDTLVARHVTTSHIICVNIILLSQLCLVGSGC